MIVDGKKVEWVARDFPDWTVIHFVESGEDWAINKETGKATRMPDPSVPFVVYK